MMIKVSGIEGNYEKEAVNHLVRRCDVVNVKEVFNAANSEMKIVIVRNGGPNLYSSLSLDEFNILYQGI